MPNVMAGSPPAPVYEVTLPDLRLHGNLPVVVRRCFYNGSARTPTNDPADSLALRYRYACDPPEWYRLTDCDLTRCSGDDFRALATLPRATEAPPPADRDATRPPSGTTREGR